jgi:hypothetical protein
MTALISSFQRYNYQKATATIHPRCPECPHAEPCSRAPRHRGREDDERQPVGGGAGGGVEKDYLVHWLAVAVVVAVGVAMW